MGSCEGMQPGQPTQTSQRDVGHPTLRIKPGEAVWGRNSLLGEPLLSGVLSPGTGGEVQCCSSAKRGPVFAISARRNAAQHQAGTGLLGW